jgi:hypothetical protein
VDKAVYISKSYPKNFNLPQLGKEHQNVNEIKNNFSKYFSKEITIFSKNYKEVIQTTFNNFYNLMKEINLNVY